MATKWRMCSLNASLYEERSTSSKKIQALSPNGAITIQEIYQNQDGSSWGLWKGDGDAKGYVLLRGPGGVPWYASEWQDGKSGEVVYIIDVADKWMRTGPNEGFEKVGNALAKNGKFTTDLVVGNWARHKSSGNWVDISNGCHIYINTVDNSSSGQQVNVTFRVIAKGVKLYNQPNENSGVIKELYYNGTFTAVEIRDGWAKHTSGGWARIYAADGTQNMIIMSGDPAALAASQSAEAIDLSGGTLATTASGNSIGMTADEINLLIKQADHASGIYTGKELYDNRFTKFTRVKLMDTYGTGTNREYVFFTKPDLHIFNNRDTSQLNPELAGDPVFMGALRTHKRVLKSLQYSVDSVPFVPLLSNQINSTIEVPDLTSDDAETSENLYGTKIYYRKSSIRSDADVELNIDFSDTLQLDVYMWFKLFDQYERLKYDGKITPPDDNYRIYKILHDQMSIYKFVVSEDGTTLLYWAKLYGCYPKGAPRSTFSDMPDDGTKLSVPFKCQFVDDMDPNILSDFNYTVMQWKKDRSTYPDMPWFDEGVQGFNGAWADFPIITYTNNGFEDGQVEFHFKWKGKGWDANGNFTN